MLNAIQKTKLLAFAILFFVSNMVLNSDMIGGVLGNHGTPMLLAKYVIVLLVSLLLGILIKDSLRPASKIQTTIVILVTVLFIFDYYVTGYSGSNAMYKRFWLASMLVANGGLFLSVAALSKDKEASNSFCSNMIRSLTPIYLFTLITSFLRMPNTNRTINLIPTQGTIKMLTGMLRNIHISIEAPMLFFGNLFIFLPAPFIIHYWCKKLKYWQLELIGIVIPLVVEGYQYLLHCGDVDVDDIILNFLGYSIGMVILIKTNKRIKNR